MERETQSVRRAQGDAQGALREALSGLGNLEQLLRSRNVGPKAISSVLPDIAVSCAQLTARLEPFYASCRNEFNQGCMLRVERELSSQLNELRALLAKAAKKKPLNAATRLKVEAAVVKMVRELGGALPLFELFADASQPGPKMDWLEALSLSRAGDQSLTPGTTPVEATLTSSLEMVPATMPPRFALNLVRLGAALIAQPGGPLNLTFSEQSSAGQPDHLHLRIDRQTVAGPSIVLLLPRVIEGTEECVIATARQMGLGVEMSESTLSFSWVPAPH